MNWWVAPNGAVMDAYWYDHLNEWTVFEFTPALRASPTCGIVAVARLPVSMEVWWVTQQGAIRHAYYGEDQGWNQHDIAPINSAINGTGLAAISRNPNSLEVWWVAQDKSVQDAFIYIGGGEGWKQFRLSPPGSAAAGGIQAKSRAPDTMEVWWTADDGSVKNASWYASRPLPGWKVQQIAGPKTARACASLGVTSRLPNWMEVFYPGPAGQLMDSYISGPKP